VDLNSLNGKILRINPANGQGYSTNPFYDGNLNSNKSKVWSYGLRNPFRFTLHPTTGEIYIGDVGWTKWEEINVGKGKNFGWPCYEGGNGVSLAQPSYASSSRTAPTCAAFSGGSFPSTPVLDNFNRADGPVGGNWSGATSGYAIAANKLDVTSGGDVYWGATAYGSDQEVYVTLSTVDNGASEIDLLLKAQDPSFYGGGVLEILYDPNQQVVQVWTFTNAQGWVQHGANMPATFVNGDQFGARATAGGLVQVYKNTTLLGSADITSWPFATSGGYIGLWMLNANNAVLDDFGGGNSGTGGASSVQAANFAYQHVVINGQNQGSSIQAGAFYSGTAYPAQYKGALFYQDYNNDWIKYLKFDAQGNATSFDFGADVSLSTGGPVQLISGPDTNLYYVMYNGSSSEVRRIRYIGGGNTPPTANASANPSNGQPPLNVNFSGQGSFDPDGQAITYQWNFGNGVTSTQANPTHTYNSAGLYTAVLTATDTLGATGTSSVLIIVGNTAPVASITTPISGTTYSVGDVINFSGAATDAEEGSLAGSRLAWEVLLHHAEHIHYNYFTAVGSSGSFTAPDHGDGTWMELCLTATDVGNLSHTTCRALLPNQTTYTFLTNPPGLELVYSSGSFTTPFTATSIVNSVQQLSAPFIQDGLSFDAWVGGGARDREITIGPTPLTFTANYINNAPTLSSFSPQTINEDSTTGNLAFTVSDIETPAASLVMTATSSNPALVAPSGFVFGGSSGNRTLKVTPIANQFGAATITITVTDSRGGIDTANFGLTVNSVNDQPVAVTDSMTVLQGVSAQITVATLLTNDTDADVGDVLTVTSVSGVTPGGGTVTLLNGVITYTPTGNFTGSDSFTYQISDGHGGNAQGTVTVQVIAAANKVYLPLVRK
jgi:PKD repeat protein